MLVQSETGQTPLHYACAVGQLETALTLLRRMTEEQALAVLQTCDKDGLTPLFSAIKGTKSSSYDFDSKAEWKKSVEAAEAIACHILERSAELNCLPSFAKPNKEGKTYLHSAIYRGNKELSYALAKHMKKEELLMQSASNDNLSALHLAAAYGMDDVLSMILDRTGPNNGGESIDII